MLPLSYGILTEAISNPGPLIMEIVTCRYENLDRSTWKSRPLIMKILTVHHENLNWSTWKPPPFIMKILTIHHENLNRSTWKSGPFIVKILSIQYEKSWPFLMKISTIYHENLTVCNKASITRNKISTTRNKISIVINSTFGRNGATAQKVSAFGVILSRIFPAFSRIRAEYGEIWKMQEKCGPE